jgi:antitoxin HicB
MSTQHELKSRLIEEFEAAGISKSELARRLGVNEKQARRILDIDTPSDISGIDAAFKALGLTVRVEVTKRKEARTK